MLGNCQPALAQYADDEGGSQAVRRVGVFGALAQFIDTSGLSRFFLFIGTGNAASVFGDICSVFDAQFEPVFTRIFRTRAWLWHDLRLDNDEPLFPLEIY